jgi:hypothetical protein
VGGGSASLFFWRLLRLRRADVDAAHGAFFEFVNALRGFLEHIVLFYIFFVFLYILLSVFSNKEIETLFLINNGHNGLSLF